MQNNDRLCPDDREEEDWDVILDVASEGSNTEDGQASDIKDVCDNLTPAGPVVRQELKLRQLDLDKPPCQPKKTIDVATDEFARWLLTMHIACYGRRFTVRDFHRIENFTAVYVLYLKNESVQNLHRLRFCALRAVRRRRELSASDRALLALVSKSEQRGLREHILLAWTQLVDQNHLREKSEVLTQIMVNACDMLVEHVDAFCSRLASQLQKWF
jgi:hypothetical protein